MTFGQYHPVNILLYFIGVMGITMLVMHPIYLSISLAFALLYNGAVLKNNSRRIYRMYVILFVGMLLINPLISQQGQHVLYEVGSRVITLEAMLYGMAVAMMLLAIIIWFSYYNATMTAEKFLFIFGKFNLTFTLMMVITLRLVPRFQQQIQKIILAQKAIGMELNSGSVKQRLNGLQRILSILITWALENAVETADMMKARGYGLPNRTIFSLYKWRKKDSVFLTIYSTLMIVIIGCIMQGYTAYQFYPLGALNENNLAWSGYICFFILCSVPILMEIGASIRWRFWRSTI